MTTIGRPPKDGRARELYDQAKANQEERAYRLRLQGLPVVEIAAEIGQVFKASNGDTDARLRIIYGNGTESNLLMRSLQRAMYKDTASRRISRPEERLLIGSEPSDDDDPSSGTLYVLRTLSEQPELAAIRDSLHKIGITGGTSSGGSPMRKTIQRF